MHHGGTPAWQAAGVPGTDGSLLEITCPRCQDTVTVAFYGPCERCRAELRATVAGQRRDVDAEAYEPTMHVTPNAVALKE